MARSFFAALLGSIAILLGSAPSFAQNAYIPNGNAVSVIHTPTSTLGAAIPLGATATGAVAVAPAGRKVYVGTGNGIAVIDTLANAVVATIPIGASFLTVGPYGRRLYVGTGNGVSVIATDTQTVIATIPVGGGSAVVSPDGRRLYVAQASNIVSVDTETYSVIGTITLQPLSCSGTPYPISECNLWITSRLAVSPDGSKVYVGYEWGVGSFWGGAIAALDTATNTQADIISQIGIPGFGCWCYPVDLMVGATGNIYISTNSFNGPEDIYAIFASDGTFLHANNFGDGIGVSQGLLGVTPDGTKLYTVGFADYGGGTAVFDLTQPSIVPLAKFPINGTAFGVFIQPRFAGTPGKLGCDVTSLLALAATFGGLKPAAIALGFPTVQALQTAVDAYCGL